MRGRGISMVTALNVVPLYTRNLEDFSGLEVDIVESAPEFTIELLSERAGPAGSLYR